MHDSEGSQTAADEGRSRTQGLPVRPPNKPAMEGKLLDDGSVRINVWSGPRCLSTALMYSFAQRPDTVVYDEPLYAYFLSTHPAEETWRPYRDQVLKEQDSDGNRWMREVALGPTERPIVYMKHMAKQIRGLDLSFLPKCRNIIQIRTPIRMLPSWDKSCNVTLREMGVLEMMQIYSDVRSIGQDPIIVDADLLRANAAPVLKELSERLGIPYHEEQLHWEAGPKPYDGCWAHVWYDSCRKSTGFDPAPRYAKFDANLAPLMEECMPIYEFLRSKAITGYGRLGKVPRPLPSSDPDPSTEAEGGTEGKKRRVTKVSSPERDLMALGAATPNAGILVWVAGRLIPRTFAQVSVFDSSVQGGDAVWEGIRIYNGRIFKLDRHLERLQDSAKALSFEGIPSSKEIREAIVTTFTANGMRDEAHARVTLTRGVKATSSMNPNFNVYGCTLIVLAEWKPVCGAATYDNISGIELITAAQRRNPPQCLDSTIHHNNMLNNILPKIQANYAGAADALMLDVDGFVSETNATNVFMVKNGILITPAVGSCLPGITRALVLELGRNIGLTCQERLVSLAEFHAADEAFTTGTMGEMTPVVKIDGRTIGVGNPGPVTVRLREAFAALTLQEDSGFPLPDI